MRRSGLRRFGDGEESHATRRTDVLTAFLATCLACSSKEAEVVKDPWIGEFRIVASAGNVLPPESGGFSYGYSIMGDIDDDHTDVFYVFEGNRPGEASRETTWVGELRGGEFDTAMHLIKSTTWIDRAAFERARDKDPSTTAVGAAASSFNIIANTGLLAANAPTDGWRQLAGTIEQHVTKANQ